MDEIQEISELEAMVSEEEVEEPLDDSALKWSKYASNIAVVVLDSITGCTIWALTYWYYGVLWFLGGAVVFYLHQRNWETAGNNGKQISGSVWGLAVAVGSMVIMALVAGSIYVAGLKSSWTEIGIVVSSVLIFAWQAFMLARFYYLDDSFKINRQIARAKAQAGKKIKITDAASSIVEANVKARAKRYANYKKHGDRGAVDAAIRRVEGKQRPVNMPAMASETSRAELKDESSKN